MAFYLRILGFNFTNVLAPAEGLPGAHHAVRARYSDFAICSCGGISQICQWYRVCDAGALRAEPLATLYILRGLVVELNNARKTMIDARTQVHQPRPFQRPDRSLKADWLDERSTSNGAVRERVEPARLGGRWFGADGPPSPPPSPRDLQCCLKVRPVGSACARHRAPPRYTKCACGRTLTDHRLHAYRATSEDVPDRPCVGMNVRPLVRS